MKAVKGLFTDLHPSNQPEGTYAFAKNMVNSNTQYALENELGFTKFNSVVPGDTILGIVPMGSEFAIFSLDTTNGTGYIGYITFNSSNIVYNAVFNSTELNFTANIAIKGEYQVNARGHRIVAWIELGGINPPRVINMDDPSITDITDANLFPQYSIGTVSATVLDTGGSLLTASYVPIYRYKRTDLTETNWIVGQAPILISDEASNISIDKNDGAPAGTPTSKAIQLNFTDLDTKYERLIIGYIRRKGGVTEAFKIQEIENGQTASYVITGNETTIDVSLDDITEINANYINAQAITQLNNQLVLANLTSDDIIDFQPYANKIVIDYQVSLSYPDYRQKNGAKPRTFQSGEVYAFYIVLELKGGGFLAYHIPGRGPTSSERDIDNSTVSGISAKKFQVQDTSVSSALVNRMAYWENTSETYPDNFPVGLSHLGQDQALAGEPVRHHKFPDMDTILTRHYPSVTSPNTLPELGINVTNVNIPTEIQAKINGWRIAYAKRTYNNSLVIAPDLLHLGAAYPSNPSLIWSTGGNWNINASTGSGDGGWEDMAIWHSNGVNTTIYNVQRGHSLDLLYDKPAVVPSYAHFVYKLKSPYLNDTYTGFAGQGGMLNRSGEDRSQSPGVVCDFAKPTAERSSISGTKKLPVSNFQYVAQNSQAGNILTKRSEEIVYMELANLKATLEAHGSSGLLDFPASNTPLVPVMETRSTGADNTVPFADELNLGWDYESTYYMYYKQVLNDVYVSYKNQALVMTDKRAGATATSITDVRGGDVKVCLMTYLATSVMSPTVQDSSGSHIEGPRCFKYYLGESRHDWGLRHQASPNIEDLYAPKTDPRDFWTPRATGNNGTTSLIDTTSQRINKLSYNTDYDIVNEFSAALIVDDVDNFSTDSPTTIIYSAVQGQDSIESSWSTFPVNHRYTQPKNRGPITNLQGYRNSELLIHHRDSLFKTRSNVKLATDSEDVKINSAGLFDISPEEVLSNEAGYAGTRHPLAAKLTKLGYTFVDDQQGKIFTYDGQLKEISAFGMRNFFRDNMALYDGLNSNIVSQTILVPGTNLTPDLSNAWSQSTTGDYSWTYSASGFSAVESTGVPTSFAMKTVYIPVTIVPGTTTLNVTARLTKLSGINATGTFYACFLDASGNELSAIVLGNLRGGIFTRDYVKNDIPVPDGAVAVGFRAALTATDGGIHFIVTDFDVFGTAEIEVDVDVISPFGSAGYNLAYDEQLNRLLVSRKRENLNWTLSYNPANELWTSFHSYTPDYIFSLQGNKLLSIKGNELYLHNSGPRGQYYDTLTKYASYVDYVFNVEPNLDKTLTGVNWVTMIHEAGVHKWDETINYITISSPTRCTGRLPVVRTDGINKFYGANARVYNDAWHFNEIYDIVSQPGFRGGILADHAIDTTKLNSNAAWFNKRKFIDKYVICRLEYTNSADKQFLLLNAGAEFRPSSR